jgi:hypothetical protein
MRTIKVQNQCSYLLVKCQLRIQQMNLSTLFSVDLLAAEVKEENVRHYALRSRKSLILFRIETKS